MWELICDCASSFLPVCTRVCLKDNLNVNVLNYEWYFSVYFNFYFRVIVDV